jgi:nucleoside-diphosphate kinase
MQRSLFIIKPDAVERNLIGRILSYIEAAELNIIGLRMLHMPPDLAAGFYKVHEGKDFYEKLVEYMSSGRSVVVALEGEEAIKRTRKICGATDPSKADEGTIRATFGISITKNSVHASDSVESAVQEVPYFFPDLG